MQDRKPRIDVMLMPDRAIQATKVDKVRNPVCRKFGEITQYLLF